MQALPDFMAFMHLTIVLSNQLGALLQMVMQEPSASPGKHALPHMALQLQNTLQYIAQSVEGCAAEMHLKYSCHT